MATRVILISALSVVAAMANVANARDIEMGGDRQYPYSIMAPEPGTVHHRHSASHQTRAHAPALTSTRREHRRAYVARGSSGSVLPTPLPRTQLIPPEGGGAPALHGSPSPQPGLTYVPGAPSLGGVPNLPHGPETFQDRASRCAHQQGLYGVPATASSQYMGACTN